MTLDIPIFSFWKVLPRKRPQRYWPCGLWYGLLALIFLVQNFFQSHLWYSCTIFYCLLLITIQQFIIQIWPILWSNCSIHNIAQPYVSCLFNTPFPLNDLLHFEQSNCLSTQLILSSYLEQANGSPWVKPFINLHFVSLLKALQVQFAHEKIFGWL